ncbi:MAG: NAD-dependent epimerase/dehydratase family protein [bacterium]|nr:NAD-dependent epimerase/dehydratase family protein [bacterium]
MRVYITGGSGFFGRVLKRKFEEGGHTVIAPRSSEVDLLDGNAVAESVKEAAPELLVHSAAYYGGLGINVHEPDNLFHINTLMIANIYAAAAKAGVPKVQGIGSACAYPGHIDGDLIETEFWNGELHHSVVAYGFSKKLQEIAQQVYKKKMGMKTQLPLPTNLYGEHDVFGEYRSHVLAALVKRFADAKLSGAPSLTNWGTGSPIREFIYVDDAAEACYRLAMSDYEGRLNIGTGIGTSIKELSEMIATEVGYEGEILWDATKPDGIHRKVLEVTKMKSVLQWSPPTALRDGLRKTIRWYLANKEQADARP